MSDRPNKWFQVLDAVTGLAVVATLVVLIVEVRVNTRMTERQIMLDRAANVSEPFISSAELLEAYELIKEKDGWEPDIQRFMDEYDLEPRQAIAWTRFLYVNWWTLEVDFLTSGPSDRLRDDVTGLLEYPDNRLFWDENRAGFSAAFRTFVDRLAAEVEP